jgi:hypothetical protein
MYCQTLKGIGGRASILLGKRATSRKHRGVKAGMTKNIDVESLENVKEEEYIVEKKPQFDNLVSKLGKVELVKRQKLNKKNVHFKI